MYEYKGIYLTNTRYFGVIIKYKKNLIMDNVMKMITGFFGGLGSVLMAVVPVSILWYVLTGGAVFGIDVVANLSALITSLGEGGFVGLIVLVLLTSFFVKK